MGVLIKLYYHEIYVCMEYSKICKNNWFSEWWIVVTAYKTNSSFAIIGGTDKRTDVWSRDFIIWKINSGLWAVVQDGLWKKEVGQLWATFEACYFTFLWPKKYVKFCWKHHSVRTEKMHWKKKKNIFFSWEDFFFQKKHLF